MNLEKDIKSVDLLNFCTMFDSAYLPFGLSLYDSLTKNAQRFHLYILAFDDQCYNILKQMNLNNVTTIALKEFEDDELLKIKKTRSTVEYYWTCTPSVILYCINNFGLEQCTYLDSDLYFYDNPQKVTDLIEKESVLITPHRYLEKFDNSKINGKYCVQFMTFRNDTYGRRVLEWWRNACLEWCFDRYEDGKFGDQKYLDNWPEQFEGVYVADQEWLGVAPWNAARYKFKNDKNTISISNDLNKKQFRLNFFHFHGIRFYRDGIVDFHGYYLTPDQYNVIYIPYVRRLILNYLEVCSNYGDIPFLRKSENTLKSKVNYLKRRINGVYNITRLNTILYGENN